MTVGAAMAGYQSSLPLQDVHISLKDLALRAFWDLEKTVLYEIHVSGNVGGPLLTQKSPTCST